jgi:hypothetical protein
MIIEPRPDSWSGAHRPTGFRCPVEPAGDTLVARLRGELDLAGARQFEHTIEQLVTAEPGA